MEITRRRIQERISVSILIFCIRAIRCGNDKKKDTGKNICIYLNLLYLWDTVESIRRRIKERISACT